MPEIQNQRIPIIDFLRGYVLLGVAASNYIHFQDKNLPLSGINIWISALEKIFFGPVWIVLSFLFGFGFWSLIEKMKTQNQKIIPTFMKRMFWLFLIGIFNALFYYGDILKDFAFLGIFLLLFLKINKKTLLYLTIILSILIPFIASLSLKLNLYHLYNWMDILPLLESPNLHENLLYNWFRLKSHQITNPYYLISVHFEMFVFFLWGILSFRYRIFHQDELLKKFQFQIFFVTIFGILSIRLISKFLNLGAINEFYQLMVLREIFYAGFTLFIGILLFQIFNSPIRNSIVNYGKMTLTNYIFQNLISFILFFGIGFGLGTKLDLWQYFLLAVSVYFFQIIISSIWLKHFKFGPFEWIWRSLSRGKIIPIKK